MNKQLKHCFALTFVLLLNYPYKAVLVHAEESVDAWLLKLQGSPASIRLHAAYELPTTSRVKNSGDVTNLILALQSNDAFVRRNVAKAVGELGISAPEAVSALVKSLHDTDQDVRHMALLSLVRTGGVAVPALVELLTTSDFVTSGSARLPVSDYAVFALAHIDAAVVPGIISRWESYPKGEAKAPTRATDPLSVKEKEAPPISGDSSQFGAKVTGLALLERSAQFIIRQRGNRDVTDLVALMTHENPQIQRFGFDALVESGYEAPEFLEKLKVLASQCPERDCTKFFAALQARGSAGTHELGQIMKSHLEPTRRRGAALAMARASVQSADSALGYLTEALSADPVPEVRSEAASALTSLIQEQRWFRSRTGPHQMLSGIAAVENEASHPALAVPAAAAFLKGLTDPNRGVRRNCAQGLYATAQLDKAKLVLHAKEIVERLSAEEMDVGSQLALTLAEIGPNARFAVPTISTALQQSLEVKTPQAFDPLGTPTVTFIRALGKLGVGQDQAESALCEIMQGPRRNELGPEVLQSLRELGGARSILCLIEEFQRASNDPQTAYNAGRALGKTSRGVEALIDVLARSPDHSVRERACQAVVSVQQYDDLVISALLPILEDKTTALRILAARGLARRNASSTKAIPILTADIRQTLQRNQWAEDVEALGAYGEDGVGALLGLLRLDKALVYRARAISILEGIVEKDPRLAMFIQAMKMLGDEDDGLREGIMRKLSYMDTGRFSSEVVAQIALDLEHSQVAVRNTAAMSLRQFPPKLIEPAVPRLLALIERELAHSEIMTPVKPDKRDEALVVPFTLLPAHSALDAVAKCGSLAGPAARQLSKYLGHADPEIRRRIITILAGMRTDDEEVKRQLGKALGDENASVRLATCDALSSFEAIDPYHELLITDLTILDRAKTSIEAFLRRVSFTLRPPNKHYGTAPSNNGKGALPAFPWPPPKSAKKSVLPREILGTDETPLGEIHDRLKNALTQIDINFESSLYSVPRGFAMIAKLERISEDGKPAPGQLRWQYGNLPPLTVRDYVGRLFFEDVGYFRAFVFVLTPDENFGFSNTLLPDLDTGGLILPKDLSEKKFAGIHCHVLVYAYERKPGGLVSTFHALSAESHLQNAGIFKALSPH